MSMYHCVTLLTWFEYPLARSGCGSKAEPPKAAVAKMHWPKVSSFARLTWKSLR